MKIGYDHAITVLVDYHKKLTSENADPDVLKSVAEGIEYLCYPYREDLTADVQVPLNDSDTDKYDIDCYIDKEAPRKMGIIVRLRALAWDALQYLRSQGVKC